MSVNESRQQRAVAQINELGVGRNLQSGADRGDFVVFDQDDRVVHCGLALPINEMGGSNSNMAALSCGGMSTSIQREKKQRECRQASLHDGSYEISSVEGALC